MREARCGVPMPRRPVVGPAVLLVVLALIGGLFAFGLIDSRKQERADIEKRFSDRVAVSSAMTESLFTSVTEQGKPAQVRRLGGRSVSRRQMDAGPARPRQVYGVLIDRGGRVMARSSDAHRDVIRRLSDRPPHVRRALAGKIGLSNVITRETGGMTVVEMAIPFSTKHGRRVVVEGLPSLRMSLFLQRYLRHALRSNRSRAYVIDGRGALIGESGGMLPGGSEHGALLAALRTGQDKGSYRGAGHLRWFGQQEVAIAPWRIVLTTDAKRLFAPLSGPRGWAPWIVFVGFLVAAIAAVALVRRVFIDAFHLRRANAALGDTNAALERRAEELAEAQQLAKVGSWEWDIERDTIRWSDELFRIYGLDPKSFSASFEGYLERVHPADRNRVRATIEKAMLDRGEFSFEERVIRPDNGIRTLHSEGRVVIDESGVPIRMVGVCRDVTDRRRFEDELKRLADHDALTGLLNRRRFEAELGRQVARSRRYGESAAVLLMDLDQFKDVNDTLGHRAGDDLIQAVSGLLRERLRESDVLARLGGDEFAVLLPTAEREEAESIASELLDAVRERTLALGDGRSMGLTTSIGIALIQPELTEGGEDPLIEADVAMYEAKDGGRDRYVVYSETGDGRARMQERRQWSERIREALAHNGFELHCQPILELASGEVSQYELLLRMRDEKHGLLPPGTFLKVAERAGLSQAIDRWVVSEAIRIVAACQQDGREVIVEVNLSASSLDDTSLLALIERQIIETGVPATSLVFEITETAAIGNIAHARTFVDRLRRLGCRFALDDFGAGFASFFYLKHMEFDYLKIDGEFIRRLPSDPTDQVLVRSMVHTASGLGKQTIAEFVGDDETVHLLRELGVDYAQGYHVGKPLPATEVLGVAAAGYRSADSEDRASTEAELREAAELLRGSERSAPAVLASGAVPQR